MRNSKPVDQMSVDELRAEILRLKVSEHKEAASKGAVSQAPPLPQNARQRSEYLTKRSIPNIYLYKDPQQVEPVPQHCKHPKLQRHPSGEVEVTPTQLGVKVLCPECKVSFTKWVLR